ncbi:MAG TPA: cupredoxin family copper-binding protein [Mesorhizobium sp.]|nr:cupredoxin family copper-binding protein [Mesorhizobium sp.]
MSPKRCLWAAMLVLAASALPARAETITVTIDKLVFSPATVNAKVGDTVEWVNKDAFAHTATVKGGWEVTIPPGKAGSIVLKQAGAVDYYCRFHPNMRGRIAVAAR